MSTSVNPSPAPSRPATSGSFTSESAKEAAKRRGGVSLRQGTDADIERSLRRAARSDPKAAETLIRWLARPRVAEEDNMESISTEQLERLHQGLIWLCSMEEGERARVVRSLIEREQ